MYRACHISYFGVFHSKSATKEIWSEGNTIDGIAVNDFNSSSLGSGTA